ncbi:MAG: HNH endonuclease [Xanthomonadales bacterium]|nr:HNH endonuclease [Xanthomonadales bacterium]
MKHSIEQLKSMVSYDPDTGHFYRVGYSHPSQSHRVGTRADTFHDEKGRRYRLVRVFGERYTAHRLAWLFVHGTFPANMIDHINGDGEDNRIVNLREATHSDNARNRCISKRNMSGFKGVDFRPDGKKWRASICVNRKLIHLGLFSTPEEAHEAYVAAAIRLHGEFANTGTGPVNQYQHSC